jgi:YVTN family beta-propeller protein
VTDSDSFLYPNARGNATRGDTVSRRRLLAGSATAGTVATAGCLGSNGGDDGPKPTVFVFNTGDGTVSILDVERNSLVGSQSLGFSSSFPSNQYTPELTTDPDDPLWLNVGRGIRGVGVGDLSAVASVETGSGANWLEQTPSGDHVIVSAREPAHRQFRIDADPDSGTFGDVTGEIDRRSGDRDGDGPGPCDVTVHPDSEYAYVPDLFGNTLTVLSVDPFEIETQIEVEPVGNGPARPWMGTVAPDGETLLVEHDEDESGTESIWDLSDPANPREMVRLSAADGLGGRPLTSEVGPDSETGYVFTPGSNDVTVVDLAAGTVTGRIDLGGSAFVGTWDPSRTKLYVPVQTTDEVAVIDPDSDEVTEQVAVGPAPYGATAATVRPSGSSDPSMAVATARLGLSSDRLETTYCIGNCACGHEL